MKVWTIYTVFINDDYSDMDEDPFGGIQTVKTVNTVKKKLGIKISLHINSAIIENVIYITYKSKDV